MTVTTRNAFAALEHRTLVADHTELRERRQALSEIGRDAERLAVGLTDRDLRMRAARAALSVRAVVRYLRELERQCVARAWWH